MTDTSSMADKGSIGDWLGQLQEGTKPNPVGGIIQGIMEYLSTVGNPQWNKEALQSAGERIPQLPESKNAKEFMANLQTLLADPKTADIALNLGGMMVGPKSAGWEQMEGKFSPATRKALSRGETFYKPAVMAEISDIPSKLNLPQSWTKAEPAVGEVTKKYFRGPGFTQEKGKPISGWARGKLKDFFEHDELYKKYGNKVGNVRTEIKIDPSIPYGQGWGNHNKVGDIDAIINVTAGTKEEAHKILLHEIQHQVQSLEGWPKGGSPEGMVYAQKEAAKFFGPKLRAMEQKMLTAEKAGDLSTARKIYDEMAMLTKMLKERGVLEKDPVRAYHYLFGEVMARDTMERWEMEMLKNKIGIKKPFREMVMPFELGDVPVNKWIMDWD